MNPWVGSTVTPMLLRKGSTRTCWGAYSGGVDSHALLHALCELRTRLSAPVAALHVHHGLQAAADHWVSHCQQVCDQLQVDLTVQRVNAHAATGERPEAAARPA